MKKLFTTFIILSIALTITSEVQAQQPINPMQEGVWIGTAGIGIGNTYGLAGGGSGFGLKFTAERGMWDVGVGVITLGGEFGFAHKNYNTPGFKWGYNNINIGARSAYHFGWDVEGLDTYAGIPLGLSFGSYSGNYHHYYERNTNVDLYLGFFIGASYFFNEHFGVNAEMGYSTTFFQIGIAYKF